MILSIAYNRGYLTSEYIEFWSKLVVLFSSVLSVAYFLRAWGRYVNKDYQYFLRDYLKCADSKSLSERRQFLSKYDFQLKHWTPDFVPKKQPPSFKNKSVEFPKGLLGNAKETAWRILGSACVNTFGLRMMYPGIFLDSMIEPVLNEGRAKLVESRRAVRTTIQQPNSENLIDTLFVDQRNTIDGNGNGKYLFICCDGNASFYEVGIFDLPIQKGYSALGWNYPGFAQSTGLPFPGDVTSSADAIMQFAFSLGFKTEEIILFSWSIGGFPASWLAIHYPDVKAVILDACFDDIVNLAKQQMPKFAGSFVDYTIKTNLNLNIAEIIKEYSGPIRLIRRTYDEIVSAIPRIPASNRGNELLLEVLKKRYPLIIDANTTQTIRIWLSRKNESERSNFYKETVANNENLIEATIKSYIEENSLTYPLNIGQDISDELKKALAVYLANRYLHNFESTHCQPLPKAYLRLPWSELDLMDMEKKNDSFPDSKYF